MTVRESRGLAAAIATLRKEDAHEVAQDAERTPGGDALRKQESAFAEWLQRLTIAVERQDGWSVRAVGEKLEQLYSEALRK